MSDPRPLSPRRAARGPTLSPSRMAWREFVHRVGYCERHAYRRYRAPAVREYWGRRLDMQFRTWQVKGQVRKRLHLARDAALEEIARVHALRGGTDTPAY